MSDPNTDLAWQAKKARELYEKTPGIECYISSMEFALFSMDILDKTPEEQEMVALEIIKGATKKDLQKMAAQYLIQYSIKSRKIFERGIKTESVKRASAGGKGKAKKLDEPTRKLREKWASGKYSSKDICAEKCYSACGFFSFKAARNRLDNMPKPAPWPARNK